jgi:hypothetical protein
LKRTVPLFQDPELGCVQTRIGHINRSYNLLTRAEALALDGHFVVEQPARSRNHLFMNFNGTAGLWRRAAIEDCGGWQTDTLTEDLDLSYRAQMRGWRMAYLPDLIVPGELPALVESLKKQQFRWAKGSIQVGRKIVPRLLLEPGIPWYKRLTGFLHITGYCVQPLMLLVLLLTLPVGLLAPNYFTFFPISVLATVGPPMLYILAGGPQTPSFLQRLKILPVLTVLGFGLSLNTSAAILEGLGGKEGTFVRTPKLNLNSKSDSTEGISRAYLQPVSRVVYGELALSLYAVLVVALLFPHLGWPIVPWMGTYWLGYFFIATLNLYQHWQTQIARPTLTDHQRA